MSRSRFRQGAEEYTLGWNDSALIPRGLRLTLTDMDTGVRQVMNTTTRYTFRLTAGRHHPQFSDCGGTGRGGKTAHQQSVGGPAPASGRTRRFQSLHCLRTFAGRGGHRRNPFRRARCAASGDASRAISAGVNQMLWDLRDDRGISLPGGTYTLEVTAHTTEGDVTRAVTPLLLTR